MPKSKKRKTTHNSHSQNRTQAGLTHEEIWDDSALLRSWNNALAEYEFYHSIHAKGEDVEKVLRRAEMDVDEPVNAEVEVENSTQIDRNGTNDDDDEEDEGEVVEETAEQDHGVTVTDSAVLPPDPVPRTMDSEAPVDDVKGTAAWSTLTSDQLLEKIKMSYYWAGYYSGLYDAQRRTHPQADQNVQP